MEKKNIDIMDIIEKFSIAFCKQKVLFDKLPNTKTPAKPLLVRNNAYNEIAKELGLPNKAAVKSYIGQAKNAGLNKMRRYVKLSLKRGNSGYDGIKLAPTWLIRLNKPFGLIEKAVKMETVANLNYKNYAAYIKWELLRSAQLAAENASGSLQAALVLTEFEAIKHFSQAEKLDEENTKKLHLIWVRFYNHAIQKVMALIDVGDFPHRLMASERLSLQEWRAVDLALLYDIRLTVLRNDIFTCSVMLQPLILLFKLMSEVKKLLDSNKTIDDLICDQVGAKTLFQLAHSRSPTENVDCGSKLNEQMFDENGEHLKTMNTYETAEVWALVYSEYKKRGCVASAVLLQKRWYELKQLTRMRVLAAKQAPLIPAPLLVALAKRFPYVLTEKITPWTKLVKNEQIFTDADLMRYKAKSTDPNPVLRVCCRMNGNTCSFDEDYDSSDDDIEIIDQKKETITVYDSDDEQTTLDRDKQKSPDLIENDNILNVNNSCIETLESLDPTKAKVEVIFDDDSDSDNYDLNNLNVDIKNVIKSNPIFNTALTDNSEKQSLNDINANDRSNIRSRLNFEENNIITKFKNEELYALGSVGEDTNDSSIKTDFKNNFERTRNFISDTNEMSIDVELLNEVKVESKSSSDDDGDRDEAHGVGNHGSETDGDEAQGDECNEAQGDESDDESDTDRGRTVIDDKLVKLTNVVLTPVEHIYPWKMFSKNGTINCRRFSVKNFSQPIIINSAQLSKCRRFIRQQQNGIKIGKINEISKIPEYIKRKRKILTKYLRLPRTYFSASFWNYGNVELLEKCKPMCVRVKKGFRTIKKVELSDISEVRRINKTILTAQVAPIVVGKNLTLVINPYPSDANTQTVAMEPSEPTKTTDYTSSSITLNGFVNNEPDLTSTNRHQMNLPTFQLVPNDLEDKPNPDPIIESPSNTNIVPQESNEFVVDKNHDSDKNMKAADVDKIIQEIDMTTRLQNIDKSRLRTAIVPSSSDLHFSMKQQALEKDLHSMAKYLLESSQSKDLNKPDKNYETRKKKSSKDKPTSSRYTANSLPSLPTNTANGVNEWLRQKTQNLQYFNLKPLSPKPLKSSEKKEKKDKKKKPKEKQNNNITDEINKGKDGNNSEKDSLEINKDVLYNEIIEEGNPLIINENETEIVNQIPSTYIDPVEKDKHFLSAEIHNIQSNGKIDIKLNSLNTCDTQSQNIKIVNPKTINIDKILDQVEKDKHIKLSTCSNVQNNIENNEIIETKENPLNICEYTETEIVNPRLMSVGRILKQTENVTHQKPSTDSNDVHNTQNNQIIKIQINPLNICENAQTEILNPKAININILNQIEKHNNLTPSTDSNKVNIQNNEPIEDNLNICENSRTEMINPKTIDIDKILDQVEKDKLLKPPIYSSQYANTKLKAKDTEDQNVEDVIDLCDSNDEDNVIDEVNPIIVHNDKQTKNDEAVKPHINIRIVQNMIEINGEGDAESLKQKSEKFLELLSKVAGKIKNNKTAQKITAMNNQSGNNPIVYYVVKTLDISNNNVNLQTDTHTDAHKTDEKSIGTNSQYRVIMFADEKSANTTVTNPIPDERTQMPIIQSVLSLAKEKFVENNVNKINSTSEPIDIDNNKLVPMERRISIQENAVKIDDSNKLLAPMKRRNSELMPIRSVSSCKKSRKTSIDDRQIYPVIVSSGPSSIMTQRVLDNSDSNENNRLDTEFCGETGSNSITAPDSPQPSTSSLNSNTT